MLSSFHGLSNELDVGGDNEEDLGIVLNMTNGHLDDVTISTLYFGLTTQN